MKTLNLTNHLTTATHKRLGIVDAPDRALVYTILTFNKLPSVVEINRCADALAKHAQAWAKLQIVTLQVDVWEQGKRGVPLNPTEEGLTLQVWVDVPCYLIEPLAKRLRERGLVPVYLVEFNGEVKLICN